MTSTLQTQDLTNTLMLAIREQNHLLQQILAKLDKPQLGLHDSAGAIRIYANRSNGCLWYTVTDGNVTPITQTALTAVAQLTPAQLQYPLTIAPQAGSDESVLFCRVFSQGELIKGIYSDETDWRTVAQAAIATVRQAQAQ